MEDADRLALERPHITLSQSEEVPAFDGLQTPINTFTELLNAAQSVERSTLTTKGDAILAVDSSVIRRRLRNRVSCRKTRLKRKLQQHALEIITRERQERHKFLTQLVHELGIHDSNERMRVSDCSHYDAIFRELTAKSLHYSLVDPDYSGWTHDDVATDITISNDAAAISSTRRSKRQRRVYDKDVSTAICSDSAAPQNMFFEQWRPIVDGLQNVDLKLQRMHEIESEAGVFDRHCYWKFVAVSSAKLQQDGEIAAVAVSGVTYLKFYGRHVQEVNISTTQREFHIPFNLAATPTNSIQEIVM